MLYMVEETYKHGAADQIYERLQLHGRMLPDGLERLDSWVTQDRTFCYQLMQTENVGLFEDWTQHWSDLVEFKIVPVITSDDAQA